MLTDIFADRYLSRPLWAQYGEIETKLLNQCFRIVIEQVIPYWVDGKESPAAKTKWLALHDKLSMELGVDELSPKVYIINTLSGFWTIDQVCKNFVCAKYTGSVPPDRFIKERISFIELAFRERDEELAAINRELPEKIQAATQKYNMEKLSGKRFPINYADIIRTSTETLNRNFSASVHELNERLRRANAPLNYHNGFIQINSDKLVEEQVEEVFWEVVAEPKWKNVDIDMKEALDRRDSNDRDPAFYAARALESTIKIISDQMGWTHGKEKGAHNYVDNLSSKKNGGFIEDWEQKVLKDFFTRVRNPLGHGPGSEEMPKLTMEQTNWAIETCMSWIKSLVQRMPKPASI